MVVDVTEEERGERERKMVTERERNGCETWLGNNVFCEQGPLVHATYVILIKISLSIFSYVSD